MNGLLLLGIQNSECRSNIHVDGVNFIVLAFTEIVDVMGTTAYQL